MVDEEEEAQSKELEQELRKGDGAREVAVVFGREGGGLLTCM